MLQDVDKDNGDEILRGVNKLLEKVDQLVLREMVAANKGLEDIIAAKAFDSHMLAKVQNCYIKNTGLSPSGSTGGLRNTEIIAYSYLGLYIIGLIKNENENLLMRYVLHMFETGERKVRTQWFKNVYDEIFAPDCGDILSSYEYQAKRIAKPRDYMKATGILAAQGIVTIVFLAGETILRYPVNTKTAIQNLERQLPDACYFETKASLWEAAQKQIDHHCAKMASDALKKWI